MFLDSAHGQNESDEDSLYNIFPITRLGLASYFLAMVYLLLCWNASKRFHRVRRFTIHWNLHKLLHLFLLSHAFVRMVAFATISAFSISVSTSENKGYPALVILFIFPEFVFFCSYILLFFNWLEMFIFSHEQYIFNFSTFQRSWKVLFSLILCTFVVLQIVLFLELVFTSASEQSHILNVIYYILVYSNLGAPALVCLIWIYVNFLLLSGFPFISATALSRVRSLSWSLFVWSLGRIFRAIMLWIFNIGASWATVSINFLSILIVGSLVIAEIIPFNMMMDWATVSLLLLADHGDTYEMIENEASYLDLESAEMSWEIDPQELQVSAAGLKLKQNQYMTTVDGTWRGNQVSVTMFQMAEIQHSVTKDLLNEVASLNSLFHPNIAAYHGACIVGNSIYIINEGFPRGSLFSVIQKSIRPFGKEFILRTAKQTCSAFSFLHQSAERRAVVHGLLSSKSIMLNENMDVFVLHVGLLRLRMYTEVSLVTRVDTAWTAPERIAGKRTVLKSLLTFAAATPASDVYAFGIILWELCTREEPFPNQDSLFFRSSVLQKNVRPALYNDIPQEFALVSSVRLELTHRLFNSVGLRVVKTDLAFWKSRPCLRPLSSFHLQQRIPTNPMAWGIFLRNTTHLPRALRKVIQQRLKGHQHFKI